jgi:DNA-binding transcriptional ArsR family regulator
VAARVGITERAVQMILADLEEAGIVTRKREGRRNRYSIHANKPLRHPIESHRTVAELLQLIVGPT